jgi:hypothetical protein
MIRVKCSHFRAKAAHISGYLPPVKEEKLVVIGKLGEYSDKSDPIIGN